MSSIDDDPELRTLEARVTRRAYGAASDISDLASTEVIREAIIKLGVREFAIGLLHGFDGMSVEIEHALIESAADLKRWRLEKAQDEKSK